MKSLAVALLATLVLLSQAQAKEPLLKGRYEVCRVYDGDTFYVSREGFCVPYVHLVRVRLLGVDARERLQPGGDDDKYFLQGLVDRREVDLDCRSWSWDRIVCKVTTYLGGQSIDVAESVARTGHGFVVAHYVHQKDLQGYRQGLLEAEDYAEAEKLGVWSEPTFKPWEFRPQHRRQLNRFGGPQ